mmetsp:Transcript_13119/g.21475  ORF Transcript_13119/g.21475 Transcript_13119/m.21475 type:complete len:360 (+) Transcript_13119:196-1275(+)|eukprot:CAMPEP_0114425328 /NCGR_PEP_ID=MMETSP0103-20121206/7176_1 /TAXON_ID=37642 ORGANISM="Paraphysomonas imperforata, Strain PA2" /NCGR_SAMPLE_ID=MMETSP0103 /ASSEMBLY_ACC=CAM_ASM_000201 /LENGTH=359 /DNA_ID=CAMNT_0001594155 /DNA_START=150 /DNA_END=1229 /DNA_ORIENTATION=+
MSSIQEKMEALRLQKATYAGSGGMRKYHNAPKSLHNKHPSLPRTTAKTNHYQPNAQISLFANQQKKDPSVIQITSTNVPVSPIQANRKANSSVRGTSTSTSAPSISIPSNETKTSSNKNPNLIPSLDPLQSCYGTRSRALKPPLEEGVDMPKGILSRPSSPAVTPGKKKKVSFNFEARPSSSSYVPPSHLTPSPSPAPTTSVRNTNASNGRPMRPSLSEQLTAIADKAGEVTADIKAKAGIESDSKLEKPLLISPAKNFTVGHLQCRYPAPVEFFNDRFEYKFHHPFQNAEIHLTMYYRDMTNASLTTSPSPGKLIFRVPRHLVHFAADYDPSKHYVVLFLASNVDLQFIKKSIMPKIK